MGYFIVYYYGNVVLSINIKVLSSAWNSIKLSKSLNFNYGFFKN